MKISIDRERVKVYLWIGLAYVSIWIFRDLVQTPETFFKRVWNNIWFMIYLIPLNFVIYEYALPFIKLTWRGLLIAPLILFIILMSDSFFFYGWRGFGINLNLYFPLIEHENVYKAVAYHFPYALISLFFFGIVKQIGRAHV